MNELTAIAHETRPVDAYRMSTDAAGLCREIVIASATQIQGRKFVTVEGWQAIAIAHGCVAGARDVEKVEGGVRAIGEVRRMSDGQVIATAEGFVGEDETTWYGGKDKRGKVHDRRNDYAIRAMAQTRAISRACRSAFAHVVVMMKANLATTPAEEMGHEPEIEGQVIDAAPVQSKVEGIHKIKQRIREMKARGEKAADAKEFEAVVAEYETECTALCDGQHEWWTGKDRDGNEFEGIPAWLTRRRQELGQADHTLGYNMLVSCVNECDTEAELSELLNKHDNAIGELDGAESRSFEELVETKLSAFKALEVVRA